MVRTMSNTIVTKLLLTIETDIETGDVKLLNREVINDDLAKPKKSTTKKTKVEESSEPIVTLEANKLCLTQAAVDLLNVCEDCRIDVKYNKNGAPIIGTNTAFGTVGGNKITKSNSVSFRGKANDKLKEFGTTFKLESTDKDGVFLMIGDQKPAEVPEELVDINKELDDLDDLNDLIDDTNFNFEL